MNQQSIAILGAGESGVGAALLAKQKGYSPFVSDCNTIKPNYKQVLIENNIEWEEGRHSLNRISDAIEIIKSPGIDDNSSIIKNLNTLPKKIISEIEFAGRYTKAKKICITGSNGKTTTTLLTYHILESAGLS